MRWERLFDDLEASAHEVVRDERDALADDLRDELWAERSWAQLYTGPVVLTVRGAGEVRGELRAAAEQVLHLASPGEDVLVATSAVMAVSGRRAGELAVSRTGWAAAFRAARDDGESVRLVRVDGQQVEGGVWAVARDAVVLATAPGREITIPWTAIALVRRRR